MACSSSGSNLGTNASLDDTGGSFADVATGYGGADTTAASYPAASADAAGGAPDTETARGAQGDGGSVSAANVGSGGTRSLVSEQAGDGGEPSDVLGGGVGGEADEAAGGGTRPVAPLTGGQVGSGGRSASTGHGGASTGGSAGVGLGGKAGHGGAVNKGAAASGGAASGGAAIGGAASGGASGTACTPNARRCTATGLQTCTASGAWSLAVPCPAAAPVCTGNACFAKAG